MNSYLIVNNIKFGLIKQISKINYVATPITADS